MTTIRIWPDGYWQDDSENLPTHMSDDFELAVLPEDIEGDEDAIEEFVQDRISTGYDHPTG